MLNASSLPTPGSTLTAAVAEAVRLNGLPRLTVDDGPELVGVMSHLLIRAIADCERAGWCQERIAEALRPARDAHAESPFVRRLQAWPRGYAGDFETVEYILDRCNGAPPESFAYWIEQHALESPIAQQHRNKVRMQAREMVEVARARYDAGRTARLLVIASGGAADVALVQDELADLGASIVLVDQDADALSFARNRLPALSTRISAVCRNVVRGLASVRSDGPFDLVLAGGLFDYLSDRVAVGVLRYTRERLLSPDGRVFFTNIGADNPFRRWIEMIGSWHLIHRSPCDLVRLCREAGYGDDAVGVTCDATGLALVVRVGREEVEAAVPGVTSFLSPSPLFADPHLPPISLSPAPSRTARVSCRASR